MDLIVHFQHWIFQINLSAGLKDKIYGFKANKDSFLHILCPQYYGPLIFFAARNQKDQKEWIKLINGFIKKREEEI